MAFRLRYIENDDGEFDANADGIDERHDEIVISMSQDSLDVACDDNFELSIIDDMEPFSLEHYTHTHLATLPAPVTPPSNDKPTVAVNVDSTPHQNYKRQKCFHSTETNVNFKNDPYKCNHSSGDDRHHQPNNHFYRSLKKLVSSMRQSEETRVVVMHHRQLLHDVYGKLENEKSLLSGLGYGATVDFLHSRNNLMEITCDAIEQPPALQLSIYNGN